MNLILPDACTALAASTFLLVTSVSCARAAGQAPADPAVQALLDRIEAARGKPAQSLAVDGTYEVTFGEPGAEPVAQGAFRARYVGADFALGDLKRFLTHGAAVILLPRHTASWPGAHRAPRPRNGHFAAA